MRVLITTTGYSGHVLPLVPLARACLRAGHDVQVAGPRTRAAIVERAGLPFRPVDDPPAAEIAALQAAISGLSVAQADARAFGDGFARIGVAAPLAGMLEIVATWRPGVVVRESCEFAGYLAAELHGVPHARVALGLAASEDRIVADAAAAVDGWRAELGLAPDPHGERLRGAPCFTLVPQALEAPVMELPGPQLIAALPDAVGRVREDPGYRRAARGAADAIRALGPADAAAERLPTPDRPPTPPAGRGSARRTALARMAGRPG